MQSYHDVVCGGVEVGCFISGLSRLIAFVVFLESSVNSCGGPRSDWINQLAGQVQVHVDRALTEFVMFSEFAPESVFSVFG